MNSILNYSLKSCLFLTLLFALACSDEDSKKKSLNNQYEYKGKVYTPEYATYVDDDFSEPFYFLIFYRETPTYTEYINVELPARFDGQTITVEPGAQEYYVHLNHENEEGDYNYQLQCGIEDGNLTSGTIYVKLVDAEKKIFHVMFDLKTTSKETFKLSYKGVFTRW